MGDERFTLLARVLRSEATRRRFVVALAGVAGLRLDDLTATATRRSRKTPRRVQEDLRAAASPAVERVLTCWTAPRSWVDKSEMVRGDTGNVAQRGSCDLPPRFQFLRRDGDGPGWHRGGALGPLARGRAPARAHHLWLYHPDWTAYGRPRRLPRLLRARRAVRLGVRR